MSHRQHDEALKYFSEHAADWQKKATGADAAAVNVIAQRNGYVLEVVRGMSAASSALDIGCGSGELVCDVARLGLEAHGLDFSAEMIGLAQERARRDGLSRARFTCASIFDYQAPAACLDVASGNGLIEYVTQEELGRLFACVARLLRPGGAFVVGSRNRLFNLASMNAFTDEELRSGAYEALAREAMALASGGGLPALAGVRPAPLQRADLEHAHTGVRVTTRWQYTPAQLVGMAAAHGFEPAGLRAVHVHGVPPGFKARHPAVHTEIANLLQAFAPEGSELVPFASSFMLHLRKTRAA